MADGSKKQRVSFTLDVDLIVNLNIKRSKECDDKSGEARAVECANMQRPEANGPILNPPVSSSNIQQPRDPRVPRTPRHPRQPRVPRTPRPPRQPRVPRTPQPPRSPARQRSPASQRSLSYEP
uniref:Uncharacterized protein n=1 Tax=Panagrolaimus davidi TaxID=227884 RepID=A0A914PG04_9BILA